VDFGSLVAERQIVTRSFTISNAGTREGGFQVHTLPLPPHLTISPVEGRIKPGGKMDLKVEVILLEVNSCMKSHVKLLISFLYKPRLDLHNE